MSGLRAGVIASIAGGRKNTCNAGGLFGGCLSKKTVSIEGIKKRLKSLFLCPKALVSLAIVFNYHAALADSLTVCGAGCSNRCALFLCLVKA